MSLQQVLLLMVINSSMARNFNDMIKNFNEVFYKVVLIDDSNGTIFERSTVATFSTFEEASEAAYELEQRGGKALVQCWDRPDSWVMCNGPNWKDYYN